MMNLLKMCNRLTNWSFLILTFILFVFVQSTQAQVTHLESYGTVTLDMARETAQTFLLKEQTTPPQFATKTKSKFNVNNQAMGLILGKVQTITDERAETLAYIQELEPQGFIIISADDDVKAVLGFSFVSKFSVDGKKGNPLYDLIVADVTARREYVSYRHKETVGRGSNSQWGPWLQTTWRQGSYWNDKTPYKDPNNTGEGRRLVGCVATAMAQIINYWEYPQSVEFTNADFFYISGTQVSFDASGEYGFPSLIDMQNSMSSLLYNGDESEEAYLSFGAGVKLHMNYKESISLANNHSVGDVLNDDFGFGAATPYSGINVWPSHSMEIVDDLKNGWPVQIGIKKSGASVGHSIVVDGYIDEDDGYFHLNYGWGANSPDPIAEAWYNIPTEMPIYDVVRSVVFGISKYQGWNQIGADQRNSYHAIYPAPIEEPIRKWPVNIPEELIGISTSYSFSHLVIGTGGRIYASLSPSDLGDIYHPYIAIYDKYGTLEKLIEVTESNVDIPYLSQNSRGEVFFSSGTGSYNPTNSKLYRLNPNTDEITQIFAHSSPDAGIFERPIKIDRDDNLYFVITPRNSANYAKFYCISRTGTLRWTPISFPSAAQFHLTQPAIDEGSERVYINYFEKTEEYKGLSHLLVLHRSNGAVINDITLPTSTHYASAMACPPAVSEDGTIYIGALSSLFAYSSSGTQLWEKSFYPAYTNLTPAIGNDGTLYINYGKMVGGNWQPGYIRSLNPANGNTKWEMSLSLGEYDYMNEIYAAKNGMVIYTYDVDGQSRLGGVKDEGASYGNPWDIEGGGTIAFGGGSTIVLIPPAGNDQAIWTYTDYGERGDPQGMGMDYPDNEQPYSPSVVSPVNGAENQDTVSVQLSWDCSDPDGHPLKYDIYVCAPMEDEEGAFVLVAGQVTGNSYTLTNLMAGTQYFWSVVATDGQAISEGPVWSFTTEGVTGVREDNSASNLPKKFELSQNYPNPFNPSTTIMYSIKERSFVKLILYDILGREVVVIINKEQDAGNYKENFNAKQLASGIYLYRLQAGSFVDTKKMILLK